MSRYKVPPLLDQWVLNSSSWKILNSFHRFLYPMRLHRVRVTIHLKVFMVIVRICNRDRSISVVV
jgi:hypothetical protein